MRTALFLLLLASGGCARAHFPDSGDGSPDEDGGAKPEIDAAVGGSNTYESATVGTPETGNGINLSAKFWPAWRFNVSAKITTEHVGFYSGGSTSGTAFASLVRLTGPSDYPDRLDLMGADVVGSPEVFTLPSSAGDIIVPLQVTLEPGWHALVFGTGAFGASAPENTLIPKGQTAVADAQPPLLLIQTTNTISVTTHLDTRFFVQAKR